jgi:hypothetical protein
MKQLPFYVLSEEGELLVGFDAEEQSIVLMQAPEDEDESPDVVVITTEELSNLMGILQTRLDDNGRLIPMEPISVQ